MLPPFVRAPAAFVARAHVLGALRRLDRRFRIDPRRLASCFSILPTTALATVLAVGLAGGCGPRLHAAGARSAESLPGRASVAPTSTADPIDAPALAPEPLAPPPPGPGRAVRITLYHLAAQTCPDAAEVPLPRCGGGSIAQVSSSFKHAAAMQGSAKLCDGRVINVRKISPLCFAVLPDGHPWGITASGRSAQPFRSIAVDTGVLAMGRWYYVRELDGVSLPAPAEGKVHDGCVRADDIGGAIKGDTVDFFVGERSAVDVLKSKFSDATIHVIEADARCANVPPL